MATLDGPRRRPAAAAPDAAASATSCRDFCLQVLESLGSRIQLVPHAAGDSFHIQLPDHLAWRWRRRGRPCSELWLAFDAERRGDSGPEVVGVRSRRLWEIQQLSLESGWLAVLHQPAGRHFPALWLWMEIVADGGPLARAPAAGRAVVWTPLAGDDGRKPAVYGLQDAPALETPGALPVRWGPPHCPSAAARRRPKGMLGRSFQKGVAALASSLVSRAGFRAWLATSANSLAGAAPRLRLFLSLAALIYLDEAAPWPPPPLLRLTAPSP